VELLAWEQRILLDARQVMASEAGITRQFWPTEKHPGPVLSGEKPSTHIVTDS